MYYKIINEQWNHNGYQYIPGLNVLQEEFNDNPNDSCCKGGFYFTTIDNIFKFLNYGCYLVEVTLPTSDSDFKMVSDPCGNAWDQRSQHNLPLRGQGDKFRSNKIILGKKYDLADITTFQMMIDLGANIDTNDDALKWASSNGHLEVVKFLVEKGANVHADDNYALGWASENGHLDVVKFLVEKGADVNADNNCALRWASKNGHLDMVNYIKYLIKKDTNA